VSLTEVARADWDPLLERLGLTDVYWSRGFVEASARLVEGAPTLLHLASGDGDVVFACLLRSDPTDVVTPYGYGGPIGGGDAALAGFGPAYEEWCRARGALTSFVVFHPVAGNATSAASAGFRRSELAGTVAWALDAPDLAAGMHRHHRRIVQRARADGLTATVEAEPGDLDGFVGAYEATMRRAGASRFYFFPDDYWSALLRDVPLVRVDARRDGVLHASLLGMGEPPWLHYHLGGSTDAGRTSGASHLAMLALAEWGRDHGYSTLHLGGGVGGRADSLLTYKQRFAPDGRLDAAIGKAVHDEPAYRALTGGGPVDWDGFFPAYRRPY
jgi:serine/alanine adding enzyme